MFMVHEVAMSSAFLHRVVSIISFGNFIWLPGSDMARVFEFFKEQIGHFRLGQKSWGE